MNPDSRWNIMSPWPHSHMLTLCQLFEMSSHSYFWNLTLTGSVCCVGVFRCECVRVCVWSDIVNKFQWLLIIGPLVSFVFTETEVTDPKHWTNDSTGAEPRLDLTFEHTALILYSELEMSLRERHKRQPSWAPLVLTCSSSYICFRQRDGQSSRLLHVQINLLLPQIIKLHTLREGLRLNLRTHTHAHTIKQLNTAEQTEPTF